MNEDTSAFLAAFPGRHTYQTFDDGPKKRKSLNRIYHDDTSQLAGLNKAGAGIYLMINEGDGSGRKNENVQRIRAVFADFDGMSPGYPPEDHDMWANGDVMQPYPCPSILVETSPEHFHAYWLLEGNAPLQEFAAVQQAIAHELNSDPKVKDLARVMRIPGYQHLKSSPQDVTLWYCNPNRTYTWDELKTAFPPADAPEPTEVTYKAPASQTTGELPSPDKILEVMLSRADLNEGRNEIGFDIACQIRDNQHPRTEAERILREYTHLVGNNGNHPYTLEEALDSVRQAYSQPARQPWTKTNRPQGTITVLTTREQTDDPTQAPTIKNPGVYINDHAYYIDRPIKKGGEITDWTPDKLTNWTFTPTLDLIWPDGKSGERGTLTVNGTQQHQIDLPSNAWNSRREILEHVGPYKAVCFTTNSSDIAKIRQHIILDHVHLPTAHGITTYGLIHHHNEWLEVYENKTITTLEHPPVFYAGTPVDPGSNAHAAPRPGTTKQTDAAREVIKALPHIITSHAALAMLGYATAAAYAPRITPTLGNRLPFLYIAGERESGKTSGAQMILELTTGHASARLKKATGMTPYQYDIAHSAANNLLALLDEYRPGEIDDGQIRKHHDLGIKWRGSGVAAKDHAYHLNAPTIILGEGFTEDAAALSRGVLYFVEKKHRGNLQHYTQLQQAPMWAYAHHLHHLARTTTETNHTARLEQARHLATTALGTQGGPRLTYALTFIAYGLLTLQTDVDSPLFTNDAITRVLQVGHHQTLDGGTESKTNLEMFLEQLASATNNHKDPRSILSPAINIAEVIIRISPSIEAVRRQYGEKAAISNTKLLRKYAEAAEYIDTTIPVHRAADQTLIRGIRLNLDQVPARSDISGLEYLNQRLRTAQ